MAADVGKNNNINSVQFVVTLDLKDFDELTTDTFYVRGNPWVIKFRKLELEEGISTLGVFLHTEIKESLDDKVVIGNFEVEIPSNKFDGKSFVKSFTPHPFQPGHGRGLKNLIKWDDLMNLENGYVYNDKCKVAVNVKASPLQFENDGKWLEMLPITNFRDCCAKAEFRITIKEIFGFFDVCSPNFTLKHFSWRLVLFKKVVTEKNDKSKDILRIKLYKRCNESCNVSMTCKLVSFDPAIEPFSNKFENKEFNENISGHSMSLLSWNELINPQKKFIQNDSFILKIKIEIKDEEEAANDDEPRAITLECPICFGSLAGQPLSVLICGHMYCTACIEYSLKSKRICPSCNRDIPEGELQKVYLPIN